MIKFKPTFAALAIAACTFASSANAGLIGVKDIIVTKTAGSTEWIQVAELQAFETGTGVNVAAASNGGSASALNSWNGDSPASKAIDGFYTDLSFPNMYHSAGTAADYLKISLASVAELDSLTIFGRSDCCSERDIFDIQFLGVDGNLLYTATAVNATDSDHMAMLQLPNTEVPEPASLLLLGAGLVGIARARRNRK